MQKDIVEEMYINKQSDYFSLERQVFKNAIKGDGLKILDIGCGTGVLGAFFKKKQNCIVTGVEINESAYEIAKINLDNVFKGNIEIFTLPFEEDTFDFIIMGDVLEHLINPVATINKLYKVLKPGGKILITVPNVRYWKLIFNLIFADKWQYESWGILDFTHLRFFTKRSVIDLLKTNSFHKITSKRIIQHPSKSSFINFFTFNFFAGFLASHTFITIEK